MSAPNTTTPQTATPPEPPARTAADIEAALASAGWFDLLAPAELVAPYRGMHVAVLGEQIIDADRDFAALGCRLEAKGDTIPVNRLVFRYVPTEEEAMSGRW